MSDRPTIHDIDTAPETIPGQAVGAPEANWKEEFIRVSDEKAAIQEELNRYKNAARTAEILDSLIEPFANKAFNFMCCYCGFVAVMIWFNAIDIFETPISDPVLQILVGSTAVTVIGLVGMVLTGIFVGARKKAE